MNSLVSAGYGSSSDSDNENTINATNSHGDNVKNFLRCVSDSENESKDDEDSDSSSERCKLE